MELVVLLGFVIVILGSVMIVPPGFVMALAEVPGLLMVLVYLPQPQPTTGCCVRELRFNDSKVCEIGYVRDYAKDSDIVCILFWRFKNVGRNVCNIFVSN